MTSSDQLTRAGNQRATDGDAPLAQARVSLPQGGFQGELIDGGEI